MMTGCSESQTRNNVIPPKNASSLQQNMPSIIGDTSSKDQKYKFERITKVYECTTRRNRWPKDSQDLLGDIEHYNPLYVYRPGSLQVVPDALSRIPGTKEEGPTADSECFTALDDETPSSSTSHAPRIQSEIPDLESCPKNMNHVPHAATPAKKTTGPICRYSKIFKMQRNCLKEGSKGNVKGLFSPRWQIMA